ncbi:ankyrin repeat protein [Rhodotorula toruloides]|uniref:Ankyrin repeat protein n=1 Tax=Rhodotorula toruloides TaxID=5286 RepID=A0A511KEX9_RHOTO|nr:ankyrin repeat protein [Rhodotorula toruloides]
MLAAYHGHADVVKLILQRGADPNRLNNRQQSPISGAVYKQDEAVIEALLAGGANPHIGAPTAWQAAKMFRLEKWEQRFMEAR